MSRRGHYEPRRASRTKMENIDDSEPEAPRREFPPRNAGNYVQVRRGILEHLDQGRFTLREFAVYSLIILLADKATGLWWGCSKAVSAKFGHGDLDDRAAKTALHALEEKGYIKRFYIPGQRGNFPILIDKYVPTVGALKGQKVSAPATTDWRNIICVASPDDEPEDGPESVLDGEPEDGPETVPYSIVQDSKTSSPPEPLISTAASAAVNSSTSHVTKINSSTPEPPADADVLTRSIYEMISRYPSILRRSFRRYSANTS